MLTVSLILLVLALVLVVANILNKIPLWPAVLILVIIGLLQTLPLGK